VSEPAITELEFLRKLQRLLDEGDFSAGLMSRVRRPERTRGLRGTAS
jgi:hypothetical protein